ncbi:MAG TPA: LytTR family DNA-binding domain-containing protein [Flavisolibacter sp.]|nr:LytTR family DNA-binding domain-containing protein [Flavisolibacter sp.]
MKQQVLIIDDESAARLLIRQYIEENENFEIIGEYDNGLDAVTGINALEPDLIFLDIKMPGLSGLQVVQEIIHVPQIVFTTAYDQYALKAFDANATDYLLKPYTRERFEKAIAKILHHSRSNFEEAKQVANFITSKTAAEPVTTVLVESGSKLVSLELKDVICMEADKDYTWMHTAAKSYLSNYGISQLEQRLPTSFLRIHRSFIVNISHIKEVHKESASAQLITSNNRVINVSRTYMPELKRLIY